jgi:6,7-dimethyl-8-ribityllumazine synthase
LGVHDIDHVLVPGALEIPIALQAMAERGEYDALVALGCIIRGETYHFELVANESGAGVSRISLDYNVPIANAILTTENLEQAIARYSQPFQYTAYYPVVEKQMIQGVRFGRCNRVDLQRTVRCLEEMKRFYEFF